MKSDVFYYLEIEGSNIDLFRDDEDYSFFLNTLKKYVLDFAHLHAYSLIPSQAFFLIQVKPEASRLPAPLRNPFKRYFLLAESNTDEKFRYEEIIKYAPRPLTSIEKGFKNAHTAYAKYFNNKYARKGAVFSRRFKRRELLCVSHLEFIVQFIQNIPKQRLMLDDRTDWKFCSDYPCDFNLKHVSPVNIEFCKSA